MAPMDDRTAFLQEITEAFGPPGLEDDVAAILRARTESFCEVGRDNIGSFTATKRGGSDQPRIMVAGQAQYWILSRGLSVRMNRSSEARPSSPRPDCCRT